MCECIVFYSALFKGISVNRIGVETFGIQRGGPLGFGFQGGTLSRAFATTRVAGPDSNPDRLKKADLPKQKQQQKKQQQKHPQQHPVRQKARSIAHLAAGVCIFMNIATFSVPI